MNIWRDWGNQPGCFLWVMRLNDEDIVIECDTDFNPIAEFDVGEPCECLACRERVIGLAVYGVWALFGWNATQHEAVGNA